MEISKIKEWIQFIILLSGLLLSFSALYYKQLIIVEMLTFQMNNIRNDYEEFKSNFRDELKLIRNDIKETNNAISKIKEDIAHFKR